MPRYDYQCTSCELEFELVQSFSEAGSGTCPQCSGVGRRVYHAVPVIYKGSGFYTTDYGRPKAPSDDKKESAKESSKESSKASSSSDSSSSAAESKSSEATAKSTSDSSA
ncbi:MAG: FmdB family zinc ribbon protein [Dehalococcoidia bacterium]